MELDQKTEQLCEMEEELNRLRKSKKELKDTIDKMQRKLE
jgi:chromosome segregation ATPase